MLKKSLFMKYIIIFFLIVSPIITFGQLKYVDLVFIYKSNTENCDIYLSKKKFQFFKKEDNSTTWSEERNEINDRAVRFIAKYCPERNCGFWYQTGNQREYNSIKNEFKSNGYKLIYDPSDKEYENKFGGIQSTYSNGVNKAQFTSSLSDDNRNIYTISMSSRIN